MKRLLQLLALTGLLGTILPLAADEIPHLDFVRSLRAHHYPDLALDYLEKLRTSSPPPEIADLIPLEMAKARLDLAATETDTKHRLSLYHLAQTAFEEFLAKNPNRPQATEARLEIARIASLQGKTQLGSALRQENPATAQSLAVAARQRLIEANKQLQTVADLLDKQLANPRYTDPPTSQLRNEKNTLEQTRLQAQLDLGINYLDQALTFLDEGRIVELQQRADIIKKAIPLLGKVANRDPPISLSWQARAWLGHCYYQNGDPTRVRTELAEVIKQTDPSAQAGKRLARYFRMVIIREQPSAADGDPLPKVQETAERWLADYRSFASSPEGFGVRFLLAQTCFDLAAKTKDLAGRRKFLARAGSLCRELEHSDNDFREKAQSLLVRIVREEGGFTKKIPELATFDDCLICALYEIYQLNELGRKKDLKPGDIEKQRQGHLHNVIDALQRSLALAEKNPARVPLGEVNRARSLLTGYFLFTKRFQDAIQVGELAVRSRPPTREAADTAIYVLEAYSELITTRQREGVPLADLETESSRLRDLADYVEATWPSDSAGDAARHQRGLMLLRQKKPAEAVEVLARVSSTYPGAIFVKYQMAKAAFLVSQERSVQARGESDAARKKHLAEEERLFAKKGEEALRSMPPLPAGADPMTTALFLDGKAELARALYKNKQYAEIQTLLEPVLAALDKGQLQLDHDKTQAAAKANEARGRLALFLVYGQFGLAEAAYNGGDLAKVKAITGPIVEGLKKGAGPLERRSRSALGPPRPGSPRGNSAGQHQRGPGDPADPAKIGCRGQGRKPVPGHPATAGGSGGQTGPRHSPEERQGPAPEDPRQFWLVPRRAGQTATDADAGVPAKPGGSLCRAGAARPRRGVRPQGGRTPREPGGNA